MSMNIIDLSVPCSNNTEDVNITLQDNLPVYLGYECYAYDLEIKSHKGTYFENSAHLFREGKNPQQGHALLIDTGRDRTKYFSRDAAQWMAKCGIALMGSNTRVYDRGFENPTGFFVDLFKAEIPLIANITNINMLPEDGFTLIVMPLKIRGVCTVPCRVAAI